MLETTIYTQSLLSLPDNCESWWLGSAEVVFTSTLTAATSSVLQSELESCQELLQLESENKCEGL